MLYHLFEYLERAYDLPGAGLFQFLTFRAAIAIILSLIVSILFGNKIIAILQKKQIGETIRDLGLEGQSEKAGTPTMGGIIILLAIIVPCVLVANLESIYVLVMLTTTIWMGCIGFIDDYIKVFRKNKDGLKSKFKVLGQVGLGIIVGVVMLFSEDVVIRMDLDQAAGYEIVKTIDVKTADGGKKQMAYVKSTLTNVPFLKGNRLEYRDMLSFLGDNASNFVWIIFIPIVIFIVTAVSNAANLTDGIDGLATGVCAIIGATLAILAYVSSNSITADYLQILYIPNSEELVVFSACFLGACIGFLWYNAYPAKVFMGDTGSLALGGIIAAMAILIRKEMLIPLLCGIFVMENLSVVLQVGYFKYTKKRTGVGKRIFLMSPLHHHYQKKGIHESKIVTRFWIVGIMLAVLTIITLKIR